MPLKYEEDLEGSGLDAEFLKSRKFVSPVSAVQLAKEFPDRNTKGASGLAYTYYSLDGSPIAYTRYKIYWPPLTGFAAAAKDERPKYLQPAHSLNHLYIPPIHEWQKFLGSKESLFITEGEKKTLAAQMRGLPCVGLGGVDSFSNRKKGQRDVEHLATLVKGRNVFIVFDIDQGHTALKPEVAQAATRLADRILELGGKPFITTLPSDGKQKMALDDWLLTKPDADELELTLLLVDASHDYDAAALLYQEAARYVYIHNSNAMGSIQTREDVPVKDYRVSSGNRMVLMRQLAVDKNGLAVFRPVPMELGSAFLKWPSRPTAHGFTYAPGDPEYLTPNGYFNQWKGWAQAPVEKVTEGDVAPLRDAFMALYGEDWQEMWNWFLYPIARPGVKQVMVPVIQSEIEGIGKSSIPAFFAKFVYGEGPGTPDNATTLTVHSLKQGRMEFAQRKQFLFLDDANDMHGQEIEALVKNLATTTSIRVDPKYVRSYNCPNVVNLCITTNRTMVFRLPESDRRFFFPRVNTTVLPKTWDALHKWGAAGGGAKVVAYAQQLFDADAVDPFRRAPMTHEKQLLVELARSDADHYLLDLLHMARDGKLNRVVCKMSELRMLLVADGIVEDVKHTNPWSIKKVISSSGGMMYRGAVKVGGKTEALYVLADAHKWLGRSPKDLADEVSRCPLKGPYQATKEKVRKY